jgi:hypothetical protein
MHGSAAAHPIAAPGPHVQHAEISLLHEVIEIAIARQAAVGPSVLPEVLPSHAASLMAE